TPGPIPSRVVPGAIAFVAAAQVSTFRSLLGVEYSSTLTTSNLRDLTVNIFRWRTGRDLAARHHAALLALIIAAFAVGAGVGGLCTRFIHQQAAWVAASVLMIVLAAIVMETRRLDRRADTTPSHQQPGCSAQIRLGRPPDLQVAVMSRAAAGDREPGVRLDAGEERAPGWRSRPRSG